MGSKEQIEFDVTIIAENVTLRQLSKLRSDLYAEIKQGFSSKVVELEQPPDSRSLDPAVVGAIAVMLLPVMAENLADVLIQWTKRQNECSITMKVPVQGADPLEITYNPQYVNDDKLKQWIAKAVQTAQSESQ